MVGVWEGRGVMVLAGVEVRVTVGVNVWVSVGVIVAVRVMVMVGMISCSALDTHPHALNNMNIPAKIR